MEAGSFEGRRLSLGQPSTESFVTRTSHHIQQSLRRTQLQLERIAAIVIKERGEDQYRGRSIRDLHAPEICSAVGTIRSEAYLPIAYVGESSDAI